ILELGGVAVPKQVASGDGTGVVPVDGASLAPILRGKAEQVRDPNEGYLLAETINLITGGSRHVGARNQTHKVACVNGTEGDACELFNLENDPLEEYPLPKPASCAAYANGTLQPPDPAWHYCRLIEVLQTQSFMAGGN